MHALGLATVEASVAVTCGEFFCMSRGWKTISGKKIFLFPCLSNPGGMIWKYADRETQPGFKLGGDLGQVT